MWFRRFVSAYFFSFLLPPRSNGSSPSPPALKLLGFSGRNYSILRFAGGLSAASTGDPPRKSRVLSNIQGTRDDATFPSLGPRYRLKVCDRRLSAERRPLRRTALRFPIAVEIPDRRADGRKHERSRDLSRGGSSVIVVSVNDASILILRSSFPIIFISHARARWRSFPHFPNFNSVLLQSRSSSCRSTSHFSPRLPANCYFDTFADSEIPSFSSSQPGGSRACRPAPRFARDRWPRLPRHALRNFRDFLPPRGRGAKGQREDRGQGKIIEVHARNPRVNIASYSGGATPAERLRRGNNPVAGGRAGSGQRGSARFARSVRYRGDIGISISARDLVTRALCDASLHARICLPPEGI